MALALVAGIGLAAACGPAPASYRLVSLEEAQKLLIDPGVALVDAVSDDTDQPEPLPSGVRWRIADAAAKPPAERNRSVYVYIPRSARERSSLYARARDIEEKSGG
jgi:hypothetical protein